MNSTPQPPNRRASGLIDAQIGACLFHNSSEGVFISDLHGIIQTVNPAFSRITGYAYEEAIGQRTSLLKSHHHHADFYTALWQVLSSTGHWQGEIWNRRKNGEVYLQQTHLNALTDEQGNTNGYLAQFNDITEMRRSNDHIHQLAYYDALTGLANRTLLHERLGHAASRCQRTHCQMAVLLLDIDRFKLVNETLGHDKGDQMLKEIAERLQQAIDPQTDTAGRLGGDEFLLLIESAHDADDLTTLAQQLIHTLSKPYVINNQPVRITPSIGIAIFPTDGMDATTLIKHADIAMYAAKTQGRNTFRFFVNELNEQAQKRMQLELDMRHALIEGQFQLYYQPKINLHTHNLVGVEALIRWRHPIKGMISPADFIPVAEETDLILPIGAWALEEACRQAAHWRRTLNRCIPIAVNVSPVQLNKSDIISQIQTLLEQYNLPPQCIQIEVTESGVMQNPAEAIAILKGLQGMGIVVAIDDFGTGYSSLAQLRQFPVNIMKVDRAFIRNLTADLHDEAIARTIVKLGQSLSLHVVAEGIETAEQASMLNDMDCQQGQGFWFAKPMSEQELITWLTERPPMATPT